MRFWVKTAFLYLIAAIFLIFVLGFDLRTGLDLLILACALIPSIVKNSPRLYLLYSKVLYTIVNKTTVWDLTFTIDGDFDMVKFEKYIDYLLASKDKANQIISRSGARFMLKYDRFLTVEFYLNNPIENVVGPEPLKEVYNTMHIAVYEQQVSYRQAKSVIEDTITPFLEEVFREFKPAKTKYTMRIDFEGVNPFFGIYIQQIKIEDVKEFSFAFGLPDGCKNDYIKVGENYLTVVADSLNVFRKASLRSLALSFPRR